MKLHLPKLLRNSVLACITAVAGIATTTVGTATFTGGVVAFSFAQQAMAETTTAWNTPYFGNHELTWTGDAPDGGWGDTGNWVNSDGVPTGVGRNNDAGAVLIFGDGVTADLGVSHDAAWADTSDGGGIIVGQNSTIICGLGRWAGNVQVGEGSVLTTSFTQQQKTPARIEGYDLAAGSVFYIDGTLILDQTQANFNDGNGTRQFHIGEHGFIDFSKVTGMNVDGTMNLEVVVNRDGSIEGVKNRTLTETYLSREVMSSGMNLSGKFANVRLLAVTDTAGEYDLLDSDSYTVEYTSAGVTVKYKGQGYASMTLERGGDFTWSNYGDGWNVVGGDATDTTFINGDAVVFTSNGTATINKDVSVASITVNENVAYSLALTENATLTVGSPDNRLTNFTTIPVNGETGTLSLYLSTNWQADGDSRVILPAGSTVGAVEVDGVFAYNLNNNADAGVSNLQGADLHLKGGSHWVIRNGVTDGAVADANIGDVYVDGNISMSVYGSANVTIADAVEGSGSIDKLDGGRVTFTGGMNVAGLDASNGVVNIACDASLAKLYAGATLNLNGGTITTSQLRSGEQGTSTINVNAGATLNVTGTNNNHGTGNSFLLSHWSHGGTLNLNGGTINSAGAAIKTSWAGTGRFNALSGEANVLGINFWAQSGFHGAFNLGAATSGDARVNLGSEGIKNYTAAAEVNLGCGTIGATADYTVAHNPTTGASNYVNLISGAGTVLDTLDAADKSTGRTVTFNVGLKGNGKLIKDGAGTLVLNSAALAASDGVEGFTGTVLLRGGNLQLANSDVIGGGSLLIGRGLTAAVTPTISGEEQVSGTYALSQGTLGVQGGTGTATLDANLTLGGGALQFDALSGDAAALNVTGALTLTENARTTVLVSSVVGNSSQVKVLTAADINVSASSFELGGEITEMYTGSFAVADDTLTLTLSQRTDLLFWNSGSWNTSSQSWKKGEAAAVYTEGQNVFFTNDAAGKTVRLAASVVVSPGKMTITGTDYIITGEGTISGAGSMVVKENASVTVNNVNAYTGGTEIREGAVVSINNGSALGRPANYTDARVLGNISGTGTLVIDTTSDTEIAIKGDTAAAFTGTLHVKDGSLFLGQFKNNQGGENATINAGKIIVESGAEVWTHFGQGTIGNGESATLASDIVVEAGGAFNTMDGCLRHTGNIAFNVKDAAAAAPEYDSTGVVGIYTYWDKFVNLAGLVEGAGEVQFSSGSTGSYLVLSNNENTFIGTYSVTTNRNNGIVLSADNAARFAGIKLDTDNGYLGVNTAAATIASLNGTSTAARVYNKYNAAASLAVSAGAFAGVIEDGSNALSLIKAGEGTLTLSGANTYSGGTSVTGGTLVAASASALGTGAVAVNGGTLTLNAGTYSLTGGLSVQSGALSIGGDATLGGGLVLGNGAGLNIGASVLTVNNTLTLGTGIALTATALENDSVLIAGITNDLGLGGEVEAATVFASITTDAGAFDLTNYKIKQVGTSLVLVDKGVMDVLWDNSDEQNGGIWKADGAFTADGTTFVSNGKANVHFGEGAGSSDVVNVEGELAAGKVTIEGDYTFLSKDGGKIDSATKLEVQIGSVTLGAGVLDTDVPVSLVEGTTLKWGEGNTQDYSGKLTVGGNVTLDVNGNNIVMSQSIAGTDASKTLTIASATDATVQVGNGMKAKYSIGENVTLKLAASENGTYTNAISGAGSVYLYNTQTTGEGTVLTGTNTYSGATIVEGAATMDSNSLSASTSGIELKAGAQLTFNNKGTTAYDFGKPVTAGDSSKLVLEGNDINLSSDFAGALGVNVYDGKVVDLTGTVGGAIELTCGSLKVHSALSNAISGAGNLVIENTSAAIDWNSTGKTYTGTTTIAAGTQVNTTGPLSGGAVTLAAETSILKITPVTSASIQTFDGKAVSGPGKVVIDATSVSSNSDDSAKTIYSRVLGVLFANNSGTTLEMTGDGSVLHVGSTNGFLDKVAKVVITDGARYNVNASTNQNTTISLAGDGLSTAEAGTMAAAAMSFDGNNSNRSNIDLAAASTIFVTSEKTGTLTGTITGNGHTLTKTGAGTLKVYLDKLITNENDKFDVDAGTLELNCSSSKLDAYSVAALDIANEAAVKICVYDDRVLTIGNGLSVDGVVTMNSHLANTTDIACAVTGDAESTIMLAQGNGATMSISAAQAYAGTWKIGDGTADGNWSLKASHADALKNATVNLNDSDAKLVLGVDKANLAKLTGTTGTVTGSGKVLNIANAETTGVEYSGAIGDGVTIQVSEGYQKITGADKTGSYTLSTVRTPVADDDGLGGGALLLSSGATPVAPVLDLTGYAHRADDGAGVTTILAGDQGSIKGLVLGKNMVLTAKTEDVTVSSLLSGVINSDLTLAGGKVKFHLNGSSAADGQAYNGEVMTQYNLGNQQLLLEANTKTVLTFVPEAEAGKLERRTYQLFTNVSNLDTLVTDWTVDPSDSSVFTSAAIGAYFDTNFSVNGRTSYRIVKEVWGNGQINLSLQVAGGAADLVWNGGTGTWETRGDEATTPWENTGAGDDLFWDDDNVTFASTVVGDVDVNISDADGVLIGSMKFVDGEVEVDGVKTLVKNVNYNISGGAITSSEGMGNVYVGTTATDFTGKVTFEEANSWKGNTYINSGAVVAKNAAALSDTTVNLKGGSLTVDGVALDAVVDMLGGTLVGNGTASATVDLSDKDAAKSVNALEGSTLTLTVKGAEDAPGDVAGKVVINDLKDDQGTSLATGTVKLSETAVRAGGSMTVADGSVDIAGLTVDRKKTETVDGQELVTAAGTVEVQKGNLTVTGDMLNAGTLNIAGELAEDGVTKLATVIVNGELDNTSGTITIGSAAVEDDAETPEDESVAATYGSLAVSDGMYVGSSGTLVISEKSALSVQSNLSAAQATIINDGSLTLHNGSIGSLKGSTAAANELFITEAKAEGDKVSIGSNVSLKKLQNYGLLEVNGSLTMTAATTNGGDVKATALILEEAGNTFGDVVTSQVNIGKIDSEKTVLTADRLTGATDAGVTLVFDVMMPTVDENGEQVLANLEGAADPGISYNVLAVTGGLDAVKHAVNTNAEWQQYLYDHDKQKLAANFDESGNMTLTVTNVSGDTWKTSKTYTENGLIVEKTGDTDPIKDMYSILDRVSGVEVDVDKTIDLTALTADDDGLVLKNLSGTKSLTVKGDAADKVSADGEFAGELKLDGLSAALDLTGTRVIGISDDTELSGTLKDGMLVVKQSSTAQGDNLDLTGSSSISILLDKDEVTNEQIAEIMTNGVADLGDVDLEKETNITIGTYSDASGFVTSVAYDKYFANARLEDGVVVVDRNESYYSGKLADSTMSANGAAGMQLADGALVVLNPQAAAQKGDLADVLDRLDALVATGNTAAADELGASLAGASTAVLGMAVSGDVDRQLQAIRNRTTTMGVDQSVANEDMPYFNAWINAEGDRSELSESGTEGGYELSSWGGTVGFDVDFTPTFTAGMALTAMYGDIDTTGADKASGNIDTYYVTAFARYAPSAWTHTFVATVGMSDISLDRHVAGAEVEGETDGLSFGLMYEVGRVFALTEDGSTCLQPVFNVTWKHTAIDAYTEDGSDLALEVDEQTLDTVTFGLGARLQTVVGESMYNRTSILEARVLAKADVGDRSGSADVALSALPGAKASVDSAEMGAFGLEAGAGLTIPVGDEGGSIFMDASVELRSDYTNVNGTVGYRINF